MLDELTPDEFRRWMVAYHELHLDGSMNAARVACAIHNEIGPAVAVYTGNEDFELMTPEDHAPRVVYGEDPEEQSADGPADDWDETDHWIEALSQRWGNT